MRLLKVNYDKLYAVKASLVKSLKLSFLHGEKRRKIILKNKQLKVDDDCNTWEKSLHMVINMWLQAAHASKKTVAIKRNIVK